MLNFNHLSIVTSCAAMALGAGGAWARPVETYDSLAAWLAATGVPTCDTPLTPPFGVDTPFRVPPLALPPCAQFISQDGPSDFRNLIDVPPLATTDNNGTVNLSCYVNFAEPTIPATDVRIQFGTAVCAWGAQFWGADTGEGLIVQFLSPTNVVLGEKTATGVSGEFMGFVSLPGEVAMVRLKSASLTVGSGGEGFGMDNVRIKFVNCHTTTHCYANCDSSTSLPLLNINDFNCFMNRYAAGDSWANCDSSTIPPVLNVNDFQCFANRYAGGCS